MKLLGRKIFELTADPGLSGKGWASCSVLSLTEIHSQ